ncbi:coiled-coil domain-containing protein [Campylobacter jejuni]|uniref:coiled-coil domain-containing protein n=1 Tax=Campylobacter jejuni TaxID=197 RepID=UPI0020435E73|nr:hypothetical protein [Campylobacter jejuni]
MADLEQVANDLNSASQSLQELREKYDGALDLLDNKNTEITAALESAKSNALQEVQTASNTATSQISQLKDTSLNAVNEAKNTATSEISSKKDEALGEFSQATSEFNSTKEEALSQIEQAKTEQGQKITALEQAKAEQESSITELKESVSTQEEKITALEQAKESITANLNKKSKLLTENLTWTVGSGGDYEDLQTALNEVQKYFNFNNYIITIILKENISLTKINASNILAKLKIKSENSKIINLPISSKTWENGMQFNNCNIFFEDIIFKTETQSNIGIIFSGDNNYINFNNVRFTGKCNKFIYFSLSKVIINNCSFNGVDKSAGSCIEPFNMSELIILNSTIENFYSAIKMILSSKALLRADSQYSIKLINCNIALDISEGGEINISNKSNIDFSGTTTQATVAYNTQTIQGYIRG